MEAVRVVQAQAQDRIVQVQDHIQAQEVHIVADRVDQVADFQVDMEEDHSHQDRQELRVILHIIMEVHQEEADLHQAAVA